MKRFLIAGVLALCLISSQIAHAAEDRSAQIKAQIVENYLLWQEAYRLRDAERIISFESPDFTILEDGKKIITKDEADNGYRQMMRAIRKIYEVRVEIKKLGIEQNRVIITANHHLDLDIQYPNQRLDRMTETFNFREIWVNYNHIWMLKRREYTRPVHIYGGRIDPS